MCIVKKESWAYGGKNYDTEKEAVKAALTDLGTRMVKEFHSQPFDGMMRLGADITPLRDRYLSILDAEVQAEKGIVENDSREPLVPVIPVQDRREAVLEKYRSLESTHPIKRAIDTWKGRNNLAGERFETVLKNANSDQFRELECLVEIAR